MIANPASAVKLPTLDQVIGWIESRQRDYAMRFEPGIFAKAKNPTILKAIKDANDCNDVTAHVIYSTSFGEFQVMGFNLYDTTIALKTPIADYLSDLGAQIASFYRFVRLKDIDYTVMQMCNADYAKHFAMVYNGSVQYVQAITGSLKHFGVITS